MRHVYFTRELLDDFLGNLRQSIIASVEKGCNVTIEAEPVTVPVIRGGVAVDAHFVGANYRIKVNDGMPPGGQPATVSYYH
jgi:hypothetical protein